MYNDDCVRSVYTQSYWALKEEFNGDQFDDADDDFSVRSVWFGVVGVLGSLII